MARKKTSAKSTALAPAPMRVPRTGKGLLRVGNPGHRGAGGRPPDAFRAVCRELASRDETLHMVATVLENPAHPAWLGALKYVTEHGFGKPVQPLAMPSEPIDWSIFEPDELERIVNGESPSYVLEGRYRENRATDRPEA